MIAIMNKSEKGLKGFSPLEKIQEWVGVTALQNELREAKKAAEIAELETSAALNGMHELQARLARIQSNNVVYHKLTHSKKVQTALQAIEERIDSVGEEIDDLEYDVRDHEDRIDSIEWYDFDDFASNDDAYEIATDAAREAGEEMHAEIKGELQKWVADKLLVLHKAFFNIAEMLQPSEGGRE